MYSLTRNHELQSKAERQQAEPYDLIGKAKLSFHTWPDVPIFPHTLLLLEFLLSSSSIDLNKASKLILGDLGATIQIFRQVGRELEDVSAHPRRIEDCLVLLGKKGIQKSLSEVIPASKYPHVSEYVDLHLHSWMVSQFASEIARTLPSSEPNMACVAALLHDLGRIPKALSWSPKWPSVKSSKDIGCQLVKEWRLPQFVICGIRCFDRSDGSAATTSRIVAAAHECEEIYSGGTYPDTPENYEPYWRAVLERRLQSIRAVDCDQILEGFVGLSAQFDQVRRNIEL